MPKATVELEKERAQKLIRRIQQTSVIVTAGVTVILVGLVIAGVVADDFLLLATVAGLAIGLNIFGNIRRSQWVRTLTVYLTKMEKEATHDYLTGLLNRFFFMAVFELESSRSIRLNTPLSVILLDLDHFKVINDTHGHVTGDKVLIGVAGRLRGSLRASDVVARWGGEEFIILLPGTDEAGAREVAECIRRDIADKPLAFEIPVTASLGIATVRDGETINLEEILRRADTAVYAAKHEGRNCSRCEHNGKVD